MERSTAFLIYKGSISEAIIEAQKQKKIFLVFISGDDEHSTNLENSTWLNERVAEVVSRYCIFLHLIQGNIEASQFSAICYVTTDPQKSIPSISAVGYNGLMLWQHEGYIDVGSFLDNIEKAWAAMHFQGKDVNVSNDSIQSDTANAALHIDESEKIENKTPEILHPVTQNMPDIEDCSNENGPKSFPESAGAIQLSNQESSETKSNDAHEGTSSAPVFVERKSTTNPTTIHLSIRMPSGSSLQEKFNFSDKLRSVKNYVDDNHDNNLGSYDLAIPYPRKVFGAEDADKSLSELGFSARQALIVIPKLLPSRDIQTAATNQSTSNDNAIGYFGYFKKALSYINPFSYLDSNGGSSSLEQASEDLWESGPKPGIQSSSSIETLRNPSSSNPQNSNAGSSRTSGPFGSNIHTLRHNEDDFRSSDRNTFWNGNSTQYGGNDK